MTARPGAIEATPRSVVDPARQSGTRSMKTTIRFLTVAIVLGLAVPQASADKPPTVYLLDTASRGEVSSLVPERIHSDLKDRLSGSPKIEMAAPLETGGAEKPTNQALADATRNYTAGIGLLVAEDFEGAAEKFGTAVSLFEANLGDVEDYAVLKDALLRLGVAQLRAGFEDDAQTTLKLWTTLEPEREIKADDFGQEVIDVVSKERRRAKKVGYGALAIDSQPQGATVLLDGVEVGKTPLTLSEITPGLHYVVIRSSKALTAVERVSVRGKKKKEELVVNLNTASETPTGGPMFFNELAGRLSRAEVDESLAPYLKELTARTGATHATFSVVEKNGNTLKVTPFVFDSATEKLCVLEPEPFAADLSDSTLHAHAVSLKIVAAVLAFPTDRIVTTNPLGVAAVAVVPPKKEAPDTSPPVVAIPVATGAGIDPEASTLLDGVGEGPPTVVAGDDSAWHKSWWLWTGVATIVVTGVAVGGYLYLQEEEAPAAKGWGASVSW